MFFAALAEPLIVVALEAGISSREVKLCSKFSLVAEPEEPDGDELEVKGESLLDSGGD